MSSVSGLPVKEIGEIAKKELSDAKSAVHNYGHVKRVADGAVWFVKILGGDEREQQLARIAALLHDIVRPADESIDHAIASTERSRQILEKFNMSPADKEGIIAAIRDHRLPVKWKSPLHQSIYLADKILEQMGAYLIFRRCMYVGESVTYKEIPMKQAINKHFAYRMKRIKKGDFPERFSRLVNYHWKWIADAQEALENNKQWAWEIARIAYENGKTREMSLEEMIITFEPTSPEAAKIKKEAMDYLEGKLFKKFEGMI